MSAILDAYQAAQLAFDWLGREKRTKEERSEVYRVQTNFLSRFGKAVAILARQRTEAQSGEDKDAVDTQIDYLAKITALFMRKMPIRPWAGEAHALESVLACAIFGPEQRKNLQDAFQSALVRDLKNSPQDAEYFFVNHHHFNGKDVAVNIFADVLIENLPAIFDKSMRFGLDYAVVMAGYTPHADKKKKLVKLINDNAKKFNDAYQPIDEVRTDPMLLFALWERKGRYAKTAIKLLEGRVDRLALAAKSHARHEYGGPGVLVVPTQADDLHFDAFDAINDMVNGSREDSHLPLLQSARKLFVKHFDTLAELHPQKAMQFAINVDNHLYHFREGTALDAEARNFRNDIFGLISTSLVEKMGTVSYDLGSVDVVDFILRGTQDEGPRNLAIEAAIRRFENQPSRKKRDQEVDTLIKAAETVGEGHPQFRKIVNLVVDHESAARGQPVNGSVQSCLSLAKLISGRGNLRFTVLRTAKTLAELQADSDPLQSEKNLQGVANLCATKREKAEIADDITSRIMPGVIKVRPVTVGDRAVMDNLIARYG